MSCLHVKNGFVGLQRSIILAGLYLKLVKNTAQSNVRLDRWQSLGGMAEQGAIQAVFSRLMELRTLMSPVLENHSRKVRTMPDQ